MTLRALIWDVDGTLAETEHDGHRVAFNEAFAALGLHLHWDAARYSALLTTSGGYERLLRDMAERADAPASMPEREALARELHRRKNAAYAALVAGGAIALRPGVERLMREARAAGAGLAIATTTGRANVDALLASTLGADGSKRFAAIVCAEDAPLKKPHPQAYTLVAQWLGLRPDEMLAVEDSPAGVASARTAGLQVLVTRSVYFAGFDGAGALACCADLDAPVTCNAPSAAAPPPALRLDWPWLCSAHAAALGL
jgi:HAD superfamily hydrolase (TIGR01509 family)